MNANGDGLDMCVDRMGLDTVGGGYICRRMDIGGDGLVGGSEAGCSWG